MFYRLTHIDGVPLPSALRIGEGRYVIAHGGLLLEPPFEEDGYRPPEGYAVLRLFGGRTSEEMPDFVGSSSEHYRWRAKGTIDISRRDFAHGTRFVGPVDTARAELECVKGEHFMADGTRLRFIAAPRDPIAPEWMDTFDGGVAMPTRVDADGRPMPFSAEEKRDVLEFLTARSRAQASARITRAWRALP